MNTNWADILGVRVDFCDCADVIRAIEAWRREGQRKYVVLTNPHSIMMCRRDPDMRRATVSANLVLPDGVGLTMAARILGVVTPARVPGPELMLRLFDCGRPRGFRHFLLGGRPEVLARLSPRLSEMFPGAIVCGQYSPPFRELTKEEDEDTLRRLSCAKPDIVWVGLGAPKQEKWIYQHLGRVEAPAMIGVGAAFDFHAGEAPWAPKWVRGAGLEWAYRFAHEPKRLWHRNFDSPRFLYHVLKQRMFGGAAT